MPSPRLSVIVPAYKLADVLPRCVESVRAAGVPDVEVIVVDDDSPDDTAAVARSLGVIYLHQANQRQSAARNAGAAIATGEYVAFLDNDDAWLPGVAAELLALLDRRPGSSSLTPTPRRATRPTASSAASGRSRRRGRSSGTCRTPTTAASASSTAPPSARCC